MSEQQQETQQTEQTQEPVQYSKTFVEKVLTEKKNTALLNAELKQKVADYELQLKQVEEDRLLKEKNFETLAERNKREAEEWKQKYIQQETKLHNQVKLGAVKRELEKMGIKDAKIFEGLSPLIKLDAIKYDESTETVVGAEEEIKRLKETLPSQWFAVTPSVGVQHSAPQGTPTAISIENYKAMMKDGTWAKMSKIERDAYEKKLWSTFGVERK